MPVNPRNSKLKTTEVFSRFNPADCFVCGKPIEKKDKVVEVKARITNDWYKAHCECATKGKGELNLLAPRRIRTLDTKKLIKPKKYPLWKEWKNRFSPLEVER